MRLTLVFILVFAAPSFLNAQWVRDDDSSKVWLVDGVYMNEAEFLTNTPSYTWIEVDSENWRYSDSLRRKSILIKIEANPEIEKNLKIRQRNLMVESVSGDKVVEIIDIWGFCVNGTPYRYVDKSKNDNFILIHISGMISYLSYTAYYEDPFYWSVGATQLDPEHHNEVVDLVVDFEKPGIYKNTRKNLEEVIARDSLLNVDYQKEKKKSKLIYEYVIRYNRKHPIKFTEPKKEE